MRDTHPFLLSRLYGDSVETVTARARANADGCLAGRRPAGHEAHSRPRPRHRRQPSRPAAGRYAAGGPARHRFRGVPSAARPADGDVGPCGLFGHRRMRPGTISASVLAEVRGTIGFDGLLMTDDISMGALPGDMAGTVRRGDRGRLRRDPALQRRLGRHADGRRPAPRAGRRRHCGGRTGALAMRADPVELDIDAARAELDALSS